MKMISVSVSASKKPDNAGGIAASVIVVLLLIGTLVALLVFYLRTRPELEASSGATGFSNEGYVPDSTDDAFSLSPAPLPYLPCFSSVSCLFLEPLFAFLPKYGFGQLVSQCN
ncbi:hypothetical protein AMECASPLE_037826 [Ameca splendens]|uniref:Uncharacterized protein n=1 Tax=Ameca splendens TaxID=208324 RepID=A0ABV0YVS8_9TELE